MKELKVDDRFLKLFWTRVKLPVEKDKCWLWQGALDKDGYGLIGIKDQNNKKRCIGAHRISWLMHNKTETLTRKEEVMHSCDNKLCVNPFHLSKASHAKNMDDLARKQIHGSLKLSKENILEIRELLRQKIRQHIIAKQFKVSQAVISHYNTGIRGKYV